jgi:hypothetical protein
MCASPVYRACVLRVELRSQASRPIEKQLGRIGKQGCKNVGVRGKDDDFHRTRHVEQPRSAQTGTYSDKAPLCGRAFQASAFRAAKQEWAASLCSTAPLRPVLGRSCGARTKVPRLLLPLPRAALSPTQQTSWWSKPGRSRRGHHRGSLHRPPSTWSSTV